MKIFAIASAAALAVATVASMSYSTSAFAGLPVGTHGNGAGYVLCNDGSILGFTTDAASKKYAIDWCNAHGGGVKSISSSWPAIKNPAFIPVFAVPRTKADGAALTATALDGPIWQSLSAIGANPVLSQKFRELVARDNPAGIRELVAANGAFRGGERALGAVYVGPLLASVMTFQIPVQGCDGASTYYAIGGIMVDLQTNCK